MKYKYVLEINFLKMVIMTIKGAYMWLYLTLCMDLLKIWVYLIHTHRLTNLKYLFNKNSPKIQLLLWRVKMNVPKIYQKKQNNGLLIWAHKLLIKLLTDQVFHLSVDMVKNRLVKKKLVKILQTKPTYYKLLWYFHI